MDETEHEEWRRATRHAPGDPITEAEAFVLSSITQRPWDDHDAGELLEAYRAGYNEGLATNY